MKQLTRVLKVLADKNRLRILKLLEKRKFCVCELAAVLGITQPSTSRHLKKLKAAGLIDDEQEGFWTNYFIGSAKDSYSRFMLKHIRGWLNADPLIKSDLEKSGKINRKKLCCKAVRLIKERD
ncbi:MAG: metalloregulator ArsR/SmtB family transcription factor [Candidatus Omnitrophica bacterium]|nr:metalloregulator ArsR/SmtB family transcription factor [Candidatus Omnitrophota bacterium]